MAWALLVVAGGSAGALWYFVSLDPVLSWIAGISLATVIIYGYDKAIAGGTRRRISERALLLYALAGGSLAAFGAMQAFRHKTSKASFRIRYWAIVLVQAACLGAYWYWRTRRGSV